MRVIKISANQLGEQFVHSGAVIAAPLWSFQSEKLLNFIVTSYIRCGNYQSPIQFCQFPKCAECGADRGRWSVVHDKRGSKLDWEPANSSNLSLRAVREGLYDMAVYHFECFQYSVRIEKHELESWQIWAQIHTVRYRHTSEILNAPADIWWWMQWSVDSQHSSPHSCVNKLM